MFNQNPRKTRASLNDVRTCAPDDRVRVFAGTDRTDKIMPAVRVGLPDTHSGRSARVFAPLILAASTRTV